jgi:hypothetical protein
MTKSIATKRTDADVAGIAGEFNKIVNRHMQGMLLFC